MSCFIHRAGLPSPVRAQLDHFPRDPRSTGRRSISGASSLEVVGDGAGDDTIIARMRAQRTGLGRAVTVAGSGTDGCEQFDKLIESGRGGRRHRQVE